MEEILHHLFLAPIGMVSGFLNVTAGGGSLLALPFLIFMGLSAPEANGTNRLAILFQNIFATAKFRQFDVIPRGLIAITTLPAIVGAIVGAQVAVDIDELLFKRLLAVVIVLVMGFMFFTPKKKPADHVVKLNSANKVILVITFLGIGFYGGFIQGGIGFLLITALTLTGYDLVRTNALKVLVVLFFTPFALFIFIINGQVDFLKGIILSVGNATGALIASRVVVTRGHNFIRWIVFVAALGFAVKLFFG